MRTKRKIGWATKARLAAFSLIMVIVLGLTMEGFSIVSHAQSQGKVAVASAKIRKEPNTTSEVLGSAAKDDKVTINHQTTASDGTVWYQVFVDADTLGYIRSDLVTITDGSTPSAVETSTTTTTTETPTATPTPTPTPTPVVNETPAEVTPVEPLSATVTGGENVRVRGNASTTSQIVTRVSNGSALTVTGQATGADGLVWYQVAFTENGSEVVGFIRNDYVALSGEVTPVTPETEQPEDAGEPATTDEPVEETEPEEQKAWETQLQGDIWYLLDMETPGQYKIEDLFAAIDQNGDAFEQSQETVKSQKIVIIVLVIVVIALSAAVTFLIFKIKDIEDSAYFSEVERDTIRQRGADRPQGGQKVMHTVGGEKRTADRPQGGRPAGSRPVQPQGDRTATRPVQPQGERPVGSRPVQPQGERPVGGRPVQPQGERPVGSRPMQPQGERPVGSRPVQSQGERPTATRPVQPQGERPVAPRPAAQPQPSAPQNNSRKSKNFMVDDDEFEFEFLNWDGEDQ